MNEIVVTQSLIDRFHETYIPEPNSGCWLWTNSCSNGYGQMRVGKRPHRTDIGAHRFSYVLHFGQIPDGLLVCHKCDEGSCVNPDHLFCGTYLDNTRDMHFKGRWPLTKLSKSDILAIRESTQPQREIAKIYGVRQPSISKIKRGLQQGYIQ